MFPFSAGNEEVTLRELGTVFLCVFYSFINSSPGIIRANKNFPDSEIVLFKCAHIVAQIESLM